VVVTLFGVMNIGAAVGFGMDARERARLMQRLQRPETEFQEVDGVWTWTFKQLPLGSPLEAPRGSAPTLAYIMGIPLIRLRVAVPEELSAGDAAMGEALGRSGSLSLQFMDSHAEQHKQVLAEYQRSSRTSLSTSRKSVVLSASMVGHDVFVPARNMLPVVLMPAIGPAVSAVAAHSESTAPPQQQHILPLHDTSLVSASVDEGPPPLQEERHVPSTWTAFPAEAPRSAVLAALLAEPEHAGPDSEEPLHAVPPIWQEERDKHVDGGSFTLISAGGGDLFAAEALAAFKMKQERMTGTALVLAFLDVNNVLPVVELACRKKAACDLFDGVRVHGVDHDFEALMRLFMGARACQD
jgi:hypothetical protein